MEYFCKQGGKQLMQNQFYQALKENLKVTDYKCYTVNSCANAIQLLNELSDFSQNVANAINNFYEWLYVFIYFFVQFK